MLSASSTPSSRAQPDASEHQQAALPAPAQPPQPWEVTAQADRNGVGVGGQNVLYLKVT